MLQRPVEFYGINENGETISLSTNDKIFLLSTDESNRLSNITVSDYALANGLDYNDYRGWTRSYNCGNDYDVFSFNYESEQVNNESVTEKRSIIPGIFVDIQIEF
jgi:hypothetical protein